MFVLTESRTPSRRHCTRQEVHRSKYALVVADSPRVPPWHGDVHLLGREKFGGVKHIRLVHDVVSAVEIRQSQNHDKTEN